jgi:hypothetical protein
MKTRIILSLVMLLTVLSVKAQEPVETKIFPTNQIISPHKIEVTFQKTVHILFPSEVKYVDLGSFDIIADKATGAENVVRIKAAVKGFEGETNFSVITADGCFYSFNVVYKDKRGQFYLWRRTDCGFRCLSDRPDHLPAASQGKGAVRNGCGELPYAGRFGRQMLYITFDAKCCIVTYVLLALKRSTTHLKSEY